MAPRDPPAYAAAQRDRRSLPAAGSVRRCSEDRRAQRVADTRVSVPRRPRGIHRGRRPAAQIFRGIACVRFSCSTRGFAPKGENRMTRLIRNLSLPLMAFAACVSAPTPAADEHAGHAPGASDAPTQLTASPRHGEWVTVSTGPGDSVRAWVVYPERRT